MFGYVITCHSTFTRQINLFKLPSIYFVDIQRYTSPTITFMRYSTDSSEIERKSFKFGKFGNSFSFDVDLIIIFFFHFISFSQFTTVNHIIDSTLCCVCYLRFESNKYQALNNDDNYTTVRRPATSTQSKSNENEKNYYRIVGLHKF